MIEFVDKAVCINLERRTERWTTFQQELSKIDWPFVDIERFDAVDGVKTGVPSWWKGTPGAWGCLRSHQRILEEALNQNIHSLLVMEDDALFAEHFNARAHKLVQSLPSDWDQVYLGGRCIGAMDRINNHVFRASKVILTHAYAIRGEFIRRVYRHLCSFCGDVDRPDLWYIDQQLAGLHSVGDSCIYCPTNWLVRQSRRVSDTR